MRSVAIGRPSLKRQFFVGNRRFGASLTDGSSDCSNSSSLPASAHSCASRSERVPEQRLRPFAFVNALSAPRLRAYRPCVRLGDRGRVELREDHAPAALLCPIVRARVGHEMFEGAEQKGTEASFVGIGSRIGTRSRSGARRIPGVRSCASSEVRALAAQE